MTAASECRYLTMGSFKLVILLATLTIHNTLAACPKKCNCNLELIVTCAYADLKEFPEGIPMDVRILNVSYNWLQTLPSLSIYTELEVVNASNNRISGLSSETFQGLKNLRYVDLSANAIAKLSDINAMTIFKTNENLTTLLLSQNHITNFDSRVPGSLIFSETLQTLDISQNTIRTVNNMTLFGLPNLTHLDMSKNKLVWILEMHSKSLKTLDISYGLMDSLSRNTLGRFPNLETLKLSRNTNFNLFFEPLKSTSLIRYEAEYCSLKSPGLQDMTSLKYALLKRNRIEILRSKALVHNIQLEKLDLTGNGLKEIEGDSFLGLENIQYLYLGENQLTNISWDTFITNHELKYLNLSKNPISTIPRNITLSKLTVLEMSQCKIKYLETGTFTRMPLLAILDMSSNIIEEIPNSLESNSLKLLNLSFNRILSVNNETFQKMPNLASLSLLGNRLTNVPGADIFHSNMFIKSIQLSDNPWICECKSYKFKIFWQFLTEPPSKVEPYERSQLKCMSPKNLEGKTWESACYIDFYPPTESASFFDHYGVYLLIVVLAICFFFVVALSVKKRYKRLRRKARRNQLEAERRAARGSQERMRRQSAASGEVVVQVSSQEQIILLEERVISQPPTYEEAVLLPRRAEAASRQDLQDTAGLESSGTQVVSVERTIEPEEVTLDVSENSTETSAAPKITAETDHDYEEVATDSEEEVMEANATSSHAGQRLNLPEAEEAKLLSELRIELWSREDSGE